MKFVSTVKLKGLLQELQQLFPQDEFIERETFDALTAEDKKTLEVLITHSNKLDEKQLEAMPNLKWIAYYAAGVNKLPLAAIKDRNIVLTNARGIHKIQISEFIFAYILDDYKHIDAFKRLQQQKEQKTQIRPKELYEQTICFLGTGEIASRAAMLAKAFEMKTIGLNTNGRAVQHFDETFTMDARKEAFAKADIIVNVLPSTKATTDLLTIEDFEAMGEDALFINVGRGTVVKEDILYHALKEHIIRQAAIDVYYEEPIDSANKLYQLDNIFMTPHITGLSKYYNKRATDILIHNIKLGLNDNEHFKNLVDLEKGY